MKRTRNYALWLGIALCIPFGTASRALAADHDTPPPTADAQHHKPMSDADWAALFDEKTPLADRQRVVANLEQSPDLSDPHDLYMLGSLYHIGQHAHGSPVQEDQEKASLYLGNAAVRGSVLAMAKMAELKLAAGQYREAMNWAQIFAHYALLSKADYTPQESYAAELVNRIMDILGQSAMPAVMKDVNSFVAVNDTQIRVGMAGEAMLEHLHPQNTGHRYHVEPFGQRLPTSGFADYILAFRPDGSVANIQLIDAVPRTDMGAVLHEKAETMMLKPTTQDSSLRYAWVPLLMGDERYRLWSKH
jgi:hypothetical protein